MTQVCMLVRNSVSKDARVLKEADSLVEQGYDVAVIGVKDNNISDPRDTTEKGVEIYRVSWRAKGAQLVLAAYMLMILLFGVLFASFFSAVPVSTQISVFQILLVLVSILFVYKKLPKILKRVRKKVRPELMLALIAVSVLGVTQIPLQEQVYVYQAAFFIGFLAVISVKGKKLKKTADIYRRVEYGENSASTQGTYSYSPIGIYRFVRDIPKNIISLFSFLVKQVSALYGHGVGAGEAMDELRPDIIHAHDISTLPIGAYYANKYGVKLIYDAHEMYEDAVGVSKGGAVFYRTIHRMCQKYIDGFITINDSFCEIYKERYPDFPEPTLVKNATRYVERFEYDGRLHEAADLEKDIKIILFQGGFSKWRGIPHLLSAVPYLDDGWCMVFMGWGHLENEIRLASERYPGKVRLVPAAPQYELPYWSAGAYVGVIPYEDHGINHMYCTPNKLWEYPNAGVPIIAAPRVELKKTIEEFSIGKVFGEPVKAESLAKTLMLSVEEHEFMQRNCHDYAKTQAWDNYEKNIFSLYDSLLRS